MANEPGEAPKIIVDSDWKSKAQAEKERLAEVDAAAEAKKPAGGGGAGGQGGLPKADFMSLVGMLATQAVMYLGGMADRKTGAAIFDPEYAGHMIDLLSVLEEKSKGNLTPEEASELNAVLHELRGRFVELSRMVATRGGGQAGAMPASGVSPVLPQ
ncbi:MAG TPA: DUF1844 domain-containing protein [Phycisphaerales bacterium]|nr:DUF1844 domain-containing protein [Phycisphaerales bacterium]